MIVERIDFPTQLANFLPIDFDAPLEDDLLAGTPRGDSSLGQELLQTNHGLNNEDRVIRNRWCVVEENFGISDYSLRSAYSSPLVFRKPVMRSPGFHCPRFLSNSKRSKRLSTFRFPPRVAAARRLRCCDINLLFSNT